MLSNIGCGCMRNKVLIRNVRYLTASTLKHGILVGNNNNTNGRIGLKIDNELVTSRAASTYIQKFSHFSSSTQFPMIFQRRSISSEEKTKVYTI